MADGFATLPRAGTVEVIQEYGTAPATPARPILSAVIIGESYQVETQKFAGFYQGRYQVLDENVGTGTGVQSVFYLDFEPVILSTVELHVGSISGTLLTPTTHYTVAVTGKITLTPAGVAALGLNELHAAYLYALAQTYIYPEIKQGAEILSPGTDVSVYLRTAEDIFNITDGFSVIVDADSVTVPGDIQPFRYITTTNGQVEVLTVTGTVEDTSLDFYDLGVRSGDVVRFITDATDLQYPDSIVSTDTAEHVVLTIPSTNTITISPDIAAQGGKVEYEIIRKGSQNGDLLISYRARRQDKVGLLLEYEDVTQVEEDLGPISVDNPLAYGLSKALGATDRTVFGVMVKDQDSLTEHQKALDILEGEEVYAMVPLTLDAAIHQVYNQHCVNLSDAASMHERRVYVTAQASTRHSFQTLSVTGSVSVGSTTFTDANAKFYSNGVPVGSVIRLQSPTSVELANVDRTELIIASVTSETTATLVSPVTRGTIVEGEAVGSGTGAQTNFQLNATTNVIPTSVVMYLDGARVDSTEYTASSNGLVVFVNPPGLGVAVTSDYEVSTITGIQYTVESQELTNYEIANDIAAVGQGYMSRRITVTFADKAVVEGGTETEPYYFNCALAGLVSALPPNQPIANIPVPGFTAVKHIRKFTETHFGIMAAGGVSCFIQDRDTSPIVLRNWMTTDMTNVNTRECSIVQMADYYSKYLRRTVAPIAGRFNITEDYIDNMLRPAINGVNREMIASGFAGTGTAILSIEQSTIQKDQIYVLEELELFAPANKITITVRII